MGYVPLDKRAYFVPEVLDGMEQLALVCIDNIECIAGDEEWEMAIFNLYNRIPETGRTRLFITGDRPPRQLNLRLPDLASRPDWGQIYKLQPLSDEEKLLALQLRGKLRGFELPEDVGRFLLKRLDREMRTLFMTLDQLDRASITAQRKLTIPFVKEIRGCSGDRKERARQCAPEFEFTKSPAPAPAAGRYAPCCLSPRSGVRSVSGSPSSLPAAVLRSGCRPPASIPCTDLLFAHQIARGCEA